MNEWKWKMENENEMEMEIMKTLVFLLIIF